MVAVVVGAMPLLRTPKEVVVQRAAPLGPTSPSGPMAQALPTTTTTTTATMCVAVMVVVVVPGRRGTHGRRRMGTHSQSGL